MVGRRVTADVDGSVVVFVVGMRVNAYWKLHRWLPVALAMPRMLRELQADPESGLLGSEGMVSPPRTLLSLQYWESVDALREYARDPAGEHLPAWVSYNRDTAGSGAVGVFHETYVVDGEGSHESVYVDVPAFGLGRATDVRPADGASATAAGRLGRTDGEDAAVTPDGDVVAPGSDGDGPDPDGDGPDPDGPDGDGDGERSFTPDP
jgi:hypothetical protein